MANLIISLDGEIITECFLDPEKEYLLGRGSQCEILLPHPKVSRQHARIYFDGQEWRCKVISKFGFILVNGHNTNEISLGEGAHFSIPPYEVKFTDYEKQKSSEGHEDVSILNDDKTVNLDEHTHIGSISLKAILLRLDRSPSAANEIVLTTQKMIAGRGSHCDIIIDDTHASRKHFSIHFDRRNYVLTDLESANKTYVNSKEIKEHLLESGDVITVGNDRYRFELINPEFENLPAVIQPPLQPAVIKFVPQKNTSQLIQLLNQTATKINSTKNAKTKITAIVLIFAFIIYSALTGSNKSADTRNIASQSLSNGQQGVSTFDRLPLEQKKFVDETYNLALNLYTTGKYDLAAIEIAKVLQTVNNYKDARNIQSLCQQAAEIKKQQDENDRENQDQEALKQKVSDILDGCDNLFRAKKYEQIEDCTSQISELDPDNERASNLRIAAKQAFDEILNSKEHRVENARRKLAAERNYEQAKRDLAAKRLPAALTNLRKIEKSSFPDTDGLKERARQDIAIVKARMLKESQSLVAEGKASFDAKEYGDALTKVNQALALAPFNEDAKNLLSTTQRELHVEMKNMYSESVIEENLGNIESAKEKWSTIIKQDEKSDQYYEKAQMKLRKYEK